MNPELTRYQSGYQAALQQFCASPGLLPGKQKAELLGKQALQLGLSSKETLKVHTQALVGLLEAGKGKRVQERLIERGSTFYGLLINVVNNKASDPASAPKKLKEMVATLLTRTKELAASNKKLQHEVEQRKAGEKLQQVSEMKTRQLLAKSLRMEDELRRLSRRLFVVQEEERKKISRELHDVIAQALAGINLRLAGLQTKSSSASHSLHQKIEDTRALVQQTVDIVHRFARELRPAVLDDLGFIPALQSHIKSLRQQCKLRITLVVSPEIERIGMAEKIACYRVIQESLFNVVQHAKATRASVSIRRTAGGFTLSVRDNGKGFSMLNASAIVSGGHLGLLGMRERIEMVGGTFHVESSRDKFTAIRVYLPHPKETTKPSARK